MPIFTTWVTFDNTNGRTNGGHRLDGKPADAAGELVGARAPGGANGDGMVFDIASIDGSNAGTPATFDGANGAYPDAGLIAAAGDLSGTAIGTFTNMDTDAAAATAADSTTAVAAAVAPTLTTLVNFNGANGKTPTAGLIADAAGDLFGTTSDGGANGDGTVFEIAKTGGSYASTPTTLTSFNAPGSNGTFAEAGLIADAAGDLFGEMAPGGANFAGTIFEIAKTGGSYASMPITLVSFNGTDGRYPYGGLIADAAGDLFGTTTAGGTNNDGTVFELVNNGAGSYALTTLASFNGATYPYGVIADAAGDLFGTTSAGGANNDGTVFEVAKTGGGYASTPTTVVSFNGANGANPVAGLIADAAGDLFGTTGGGGANGDGTVFELVNNGAGSYTLTTLANFNGTDGQDPSGLIADAAGDLFGTTFYGGATYQAGVSNGDGTVFEIAKTGGSYASTPITLFTFNGIDGNGSEAALTADAAGDLFGTTDYGGANGDGTVFELSGTGFQVPGPPVLSGGGNSVNYRPQGAAVAVDAGLGVSDATSTTLAGATVAISAGFLAGDTLNFTNQNGIAGSYNLGTGVLTLTGSASLANYQAALESVSFSSTSGNPSNSGTDPSRTVSWTVTDGTLSSNTITSTIVVGTTEVPILTTLVSFNGVDGANPMSGLIADAAGDLFGTTAYGGANGDVSVFEGDGTVFEIAKTAGGYASTPSTLVSFNGVGNGASPEGTGGLIADAAGDLFGTTYLGGAYGDGTVFELVNNGGGSYTPITLVNFNGTDGANPTANLIADAAGDLFGTTTSGGVYGDGTVFELVNNGGGSYTPITLVNFNSGNGSEASLIADAAGDLFGTTALGGAYGAGTVFEIVKTSSGYASTPTTLATFNGTNGNQLVEGGLTADAAGDLFGIAGDGGTYGDGTVFEIAKTTGGYASTPTTLVSFNGSNGQYPYGNLIVDAAGDIFGTTIEGGAYDAGTLFELVNNGGGSYTLNTLVSFNGSNGQYPYGGLIADAAGSIFGTTGHGGANGDGTVFELSFQVPPFLSGGGNSVNYTPQGAAVAVDAGLGVSDASSATLAGATVAIGAGFLAGDTLNFINQNGIAGSYNAGIGVLTLTGSASLANYQAALDSVTFSSTSGNPSDWETDLSRTVSWTVTDGTLSSNTIASTIIVGATPQVSTPAGTAADMILRNGMNGNYVIFDIGNNVILGANALGQVGPEWQVVGIGGFYGTDTTDMILRDSNNGAFEVYDISNNNITGAAALGQVGLEWQVAGFGDFSSRAGETDMLMRDSNNGAFEDYDISNNALTSAAAMGAVGLEWTVAGFGDFSGNPNETDMLMRNSNTGAFEVYDISHNAITSAAAMGAVGLEWTVAGFGDFSGNAGETDMLMRNSNTGAFEVYDISHNAITSAASMGAVGLEWTVAGFGDLSGNANESDMLLRNTGTGAFEVYDISHNALTSAASMGQVGLQWQVDGIANDPPAAASAASTALLVQAIAGFSSGGAPLATGSIGATAASDASAPAALLAAHPSV